MKIWYIIIIILGWILGNLMTAWDGVGGNDTFLFFERDQLDETFVRYFKKSSELGWNAHIAYDDCVVVSDQEAKMALVRSLVRCSVERNGETLYFESAYIRGGAIEYQDWGVTTTSDRVIPPGGLGACSR